MQLFYSRNIEQAQKLADYCFDNQINLTAQSLIEFRSVEAQFPIGSINVIFFTSPRSVDFFLKQFSIPSHCEIACIGTQTKKHLEHLGFTVSFFGQNSTDPNSVALDFSKWLGNRIVLFPISNISNRSISSVLPQNQIYEVVVYETIENPFEFSEKFDFYVFTSPSNARAFLSKNSISPFAKVLCFGTTTHNFLMKNGVNSEIIEEPSEDALIHYLNQRTRV